MYELRCPKCRKTMLYHSMKIIDGGLLLTKQKKRCVYCGRSFAAKNNIVRRIEKDNFKKEEKDAMFVTY